jgi:hypothetical protein
MMVTVPSEPDRYEPLPSLTELPSFLIRKLTPRRRRVFWVIAAAVVAFGVVMAIIVAPDERSKSRDRAAAQAHEAAVKLAALKARYAREARPIRATGPAAGDRTGSAALQPRRALAAQLESDVLADARRRVQSGELRGPYRDSTCYEWPKGVDDPRPADDVGRRVIVVECLAVAAHVTPDQTTTGSLIGQPYRAKLDFPHGRYAFCKIVQQPGELSIERDRVLEVPSACTSKP